MAQFERLGEQGTLIVMFNLWLNEEGQMELDFESEANDIRLRASTVGGDDEIWALTNQYGPNLKRKYLSYQRPCTMHASKYLSYPG